MSFRENKIIYLLLGMMLGFFIAGGVIWWQLDKHNFFKDLFIGRIKQEDVKPEEKSNPENKSKKEYHTGKPKVKLPDTFIDSLRTDTSKLTIEQLIALYNSQQRKDTVKKSDVTYDNIVVSKDELIATRLIKILGNVPLSTRQYEIDSILTDQRRTSSKPENYIRVEFWRSPLNYRGYKMDENKLVVFGLLEYDNVSIIGYDNQLYIKYNKEYYLIYYTDSFKPLYPVRSESIIKELNAI